MTIETKLVNQTVYTATLALDEALQALVGHVANQAGIDLTAPGVSYQGFQSTSSTFEIRLIVDHTAVSAEPETPETGEEQLPETPEPAPETTEEVQP